VCKNGANMALNSITHFPHLYFSCECRLKSSGWKRKDVGSTGNPLRLVKVSSKLSKVEFEVHTTSLVRVAAYVYVAVAPICKSGIRAIYAISWVTMVG